MLPQSALAAEDPDFNLSTGITAEHKKLPDAPDVSVNRHRLEIQTNRPPKLQSEIQKRKDSEKESYEQLDESNQRGQKILTEVSKNMNKQRSYAGTCPIVGL